MRIEFNKLKKRVLGVAVVVVAGILLSVIPQVKEVLAAPRRLGVFPNLHCALIYLADSQGFFKKQGLDVIVTVQESGMVSLSDLVADKTDIAPTAEFPFVLQAFKRPDLRIAATIGDASDHDLVVRKDRGIMRPQDLQGKSVAVTRGSTSEFFFYNYLIFNHIPAGSIRIVYRTPSEMVKAMTDGTIDAALSWPPYTIQMAKQLGAKGSRWLAQSGQDYYMVLLAKEGFLKKQPKTMEQFLTALLEAEEFIAKYPDRAQTILRNILKMDAERFAEEWSRAHFRTQLTQDLIVLMEREARWAIRNKMVEKKEMPNYLHLFYFQALDKMKPEAVSIVH
jgi:ABC-type nitrate/sulfonate/bicarbonate transport system substrate-binding protein